MKEFASKELITSVVEATTDLYNYNYCLEFEELPEVLLGDESRVKYMVSCLLKNSIERNNRFSLEQEIVKVRACVDHE